MFHSSGRSPAGHRSVRQNVGRTTVGASRNSGALLGGSFGNVGLFRKSLSLLVILVCVTPVTAISAATNNGVQLDGSSQYITFGAAPGLNASSYTLELWFMRTGAGAGTSTGSGGILSAIPLLTKGRAEAETPANLNMDWFLGIDASSGQLVADFEDNATGANHPVTGTAVVSSNVWHHAAATYGAGSWNLYLDGVLDQTLAVGAFTPEATSIQHAALGTAMTSGGVAAGFFQGVVDEARVWNVVRTAAQISANKNLELTSGTGLLGRWGLNEASGTTAANSVSGGVAGTLVGTPPRVPGFVPPGGGNTAPVATNDSYSTTLNTTLTLAAPGVLANDTDADGNSLTAAVVTSVSHGTLALASTGGFTYTPTNGYTGPDSFTYRANDGTANSNTATVSLTVTATATNNGVQLNGSSQYITFGAAPGLNASSYTLELWFMRTGAGAGTSTGSGGILSAIPLLTKGRAEAETPANLNMDWFLGIDASSGQLVADFEDNATGANHPVTGTAVVSSNVWHHAAATYGAGSWNLYLDGVLDQTLAVGAFTPEATSIQHAALGTAMTSGGVAAGFFQGVVDEARVWNVVRTAAQISANKNLELTSGTGLLGRWGLNEASGTTATNSVSGGVAGTLVGTPPRVPGFVPPGGGNTAPVATNDTYSTPKNTTLTLAAPGVLANDTDADGNSLTAAVVTSVSHGTLTLNPNGGFSYVPTAAYVGPDSFTYQANDGTANSNTATVSLTVTATNTAPVATNDTYSTPKNTTLTLAAPGVLANDTDADGDSLTAAVVTSVSHGTLTLNPNGSFSYVPTAGYVGPDSFTYQANDGTLNSNTATVSLTVTPTNAAPVATNDTYSTPKNTTLTLAAPGVLANDTDADGDSLTAAVVTSVSHGTLTLNPNGSFSYVPTAGYVGPDSFTYQANDGTANSNTATVSLTVTATNTAPVATNDTYSTPKNTTLTPGRAGRAGQ